MTKKKFGLALGGGAALGWAHIGILRVLAENGIEVDLVAGTSMGSIVGGSFAAGKLDTLEEHARAITWSKMLSLADMKLGRSGLFAGDKVVRMLVDNLGGVNIENLELPFAAVAVDLVKGEQVVFKSGLLTDAIRASISLPGIFAPVHRGDQWLVDGGLVNTVPVSVCRDMGAEVVVGVNVVADYLSRAESVGLLDTDNSDGSLSEAEKKEVERTKGVIAKLQEWKQVVSERRQREPKGPGLLGIGVSAGSLVMRELAKGQLERNPPDVLIEPKVGQIMSFEFHRASELIEIGRECAKSRMDDIRAALEPGSRDLR
ncbi:MAG: hypothetical protein EP347_05015 [Alphaproteobacteria bacterium]|nr:MAG: hypothetical protein EP347_05015 [Alphaproteobacteria bacterium]